MNLPEIDTPLLLDLLFGVIVLLFVPFGIRRGAAKEAVVSAALLFSSMILDRWAEAWARWPTAWFGVDPAVARLAVTIAVVGVGLLVLGYGGGAALGWVAVGVPGRLMGGLLAALNGAFLLSILLRAIERDLDTGQDLAATIIGGELLRNFDFLLLLAGAVVLVCVVAGWIVGAIRGPRSVSVGASAPGVAPRQRPVRLARDADAGKYEPDVAPPAHLDETIPLSSQGSDPADRGAWWRPEGPNVGASNGHHGAASGADEWTRRSSAARATGTDTDPNAPWRPRGDQAFGRPSDLTAAGSDAGRRFGGSGPFDLPPATDPSRCPTCGARVSADDLFCPSCGKTL